MLPLVVRVIHSLSRKVSLYPIIIRLLCKMWQERDSVFAHLHKLLLAPPPQHTPPEVCREILISKVTSVHDICQYKSVQYATNFHCVNTLCNRPELHGEEVIGLVLQFVSNFSLQNPSVSAGKDDGIMAMVIRSLYLLCSSEVRVCVSLSIGRMWSLQIVDLPVVWNMIAPKLRGELRSICIYILNFIFRGLFFDRPKVLAVMCDLFSLLPSLDIDESLQPLCDHALSFLWSCATSAVCDHLTPF